MQSWNRKVCRILHRTDLAILMSIRNRLTSLFSDSEFDSICNNDADNSNHQSHTSQVSSSENSEEHDDANHENEDDAGSPSMRSRKRGRCPSDWKDSAAKKARNSGKAGVSRTGTSFASRKMHSGCDRTCRFRCQTKITMTERKTIFGAFWALEDHTRQWDYIARHMNTRKLMRVESAAENENLRRRNRTHKFVLRTSTKEVKVCRRMFLDTLGT